jgi:hypothetical protein
MAPRRETPAAEDFLRSHTRLRVAAPGIESFDFARKRR